MQVSDWLWLLGSVALCELLGTSGVIFTRPNIPTWYAGLCKSRLNPPGFVFGPVWTALYFLMGISLWLAVRAGADAPALFAFGAQLALNVLWSYLFFGRRNPLAGLLDIAGLWILIVVTILLFFPFSPLSAWLLAPYLLWVSFASYLNFSVWRLN